jgi:hypothetical protein
MIMKIKLNTNKNGNQIIAMKKNLNTNPSDHMPNNDETDNHLEYPLYPESEDIYNRFKKEKNMDPEDISKVKKSDKSDKARTNIEKESNDDASGSNLDIPGSELDDEQENIGNEDEENNYYSIGGDDHNNLDEDKDEL